ncbi:MAG: hypothetical protein KF882_09340 [Bacteroidia bacterium]|nr:hypothetical protein [Bacteroidia bacterium]
MKHTSSIISLIILGAMIFTSCSKTETVRIRLDETASVAIPDTVDRYALVTVNSADVTNSLSLKLSEKGYTMDQVKSMTLNAMELNMITPDSSNFRFCRNIKIYLSAEGMQDTLIALIGNDSTTRLESTTLFLTRPATELKEYFTKAKYSYKVVFQMREVYAEPMSVRLQPIYFAEAEKDK